MQEIKILLENIEKGSNLSEKYNRTYLYAIETELRKQLFADVLGGLPGIIRAFFEHEKKIWFESLPQEIQLLNFKLMLSLEAFKVIIS